MKKLFAIIISAVMIISLSGCSLEKIANSVFTSTDSSEELKYSAGKNVQNYEYSEKVLITISDNYDDTLQVKDSNGSYNNTLLSGYFDKVAWNDYKLFILTNDKYYCFDINSKIKYDLKEYTEKELKSLYPEYNEYEWYGH